MQVQRGWPVPRLAGKVLLAEEFDEGTQPGYAGCDDDGVAF